MKISEVRNIINNYSFDQLRLIIAEMYKSIPKTTKEDKGIDNIIQNPVLFKQSKKKTNKMPDMQVLKDETMDFIDNAYNGCYLVPNTIISKKERPKWRFLVKRLFKDLSYAATEKNNLPLSCSLFQSLYELLCYACDFTLFTAYDPFKSAGINQDKFFHRILSLKFQHEDKREFVANALSLMNNNSLNRYTLYIDLMYVILEFLKTPDLKKMTIEECSKSIKEIKQKSLKKKGELKLSYKEEDKVNNLTKMGFLCYSQLYEYDNAINFYKQNYIEEDSEIKLYVLLKLLFTIKQKELFLAEYEKALRNDILPRKSLQKMYKYIKEEGELPEYFY